MDRNFHSVAYNNLVRCVIFIPVEWKAPLDIRWQTYLRRVVICIKSINYKVGPARDHFYPSKLIFTVSPVLFLLSILLFIPLER